MKTIITFLLLFTIKMTFAQAGSLDMTFNPSDIGLGYGDGLNGAATNFQFQPDGKIIVTGDFTVYNVNYARRIIRLNADGTTDNTFAAIGFSDAVFACKLLPNGKILAGGKLLSFNGSNVSRVILINADGTRDASFSPSVQGIVYDLAVQDDGKIILSGDFDFVNGVARKNLARLNADGTLDATFDAGVSSNQAVTNTIVQSDGKIICTGVFTQFNGQPANRITRVNSDGTVDNTFTFGSGFNNTVTDVKIQTDSKILVAGLFTSYNGVARKSLVRLNSNGTVDPNFSIETSGISHVNSISLSPDGNMIIGGTFTSINGTAINRIARLTTAGLLDPSFNVGQGADNGVLAVAQDSSGKIFMGGTFANYNGVLRNKMNVVNPDGSIDYTFNPGSSANNYMLSIIPLNSGKTLIGGSFTIYNGVYKGSITKINDDGSNDPTFNTGSGANSIVYTMAKTGDKFIVAGGFTTFNGTAANSIIKLNEDGTVDPTFNTGTGANSDIYDMKIQNDGKIVIVGYFTSFNGVPSNRIARLNSDGSRDTTFNIGTGLNNRVDKVLIQPDGKIILVGSFTVFNGASKLRIARLNTDGTLDTTFTVSANNPVYAIARQDDGKLILGGAFSALNTSSAPRIGRINADGTFDNTFNVGNGPNAAINALTVSPSGKIVVGGGFTSFDSGVQQSFVQLNSNGSIDTGFQNPTGTNSNVITLVFQNDGKLLIGGYFTAYNGTGRNRIARINTNETTLQILENRRVNLSLYPNPTTGILNFSLDKIGENAQLQIFDISGRIVFTDFNFKSKKQININFLKAGIYIAKVKYGDQIFSQKIIKQ